MGRFCVGLFVLGLAGCPSQSPSANGDAGETGTSGSVQETGASTEAEASDADSTCSTCGSTGTSAPEPEPDLPEPEPPDPDPDSDGEPDGDGLVRVATWNILRVDEPGSPEFDALADIVNRIDADVICVQEVGEGEESRLQALAESGGYIDGLLAPFSGPPGSGIANACMSRTPVAEASYLWSDWISEDNNARDLTRPFVRLRLQVPGSDRYVSIVTAHLKAGGGDVDRFRRMVEHVRLGQAAENEFAEFPGNAVVILGDLNERDDPPPIVFDELPQGLPGFYELGNDIDLPLTYEPAKPLLDAGLERVDTRYDETFIPDGRRLDYVFAGAAEVVAAEVYEACLDDPNAGVEKAGAPLDCGQSELASDHRPIVVELRVR